MSNNRFISNTIWNITGQLLPLIIAILVVPKLIGKMGIDRYGFLTMAWVLIGYAGLFDFGLSRAMTRVVAHHVAEKKENEAKRVASVATSFLIVLGAASSALLLITAKPLVRNWLNVPQDIQAESINATRLLALSIPFVMSTTAYRGIMEAYHEFKPINIIRIGMGFLTYIGPLVAAFFSPRLESIVGSVVLMRIAANYWHVIECKRSCNYRYNLKRPDYKTITDLFKLGGWISISNIASPLMTTMDRFILGGIVSVELVAYYATPYDVINKILVLPYALVGVMFPLLSSHLNNIEGARNIYSSTIRALYIAMFPIIFFIVIFSKPGLYIWLGERFSANGSLVLQIMAVGVFLNALAQAPATAVQSIGNPKWMAIMHIIELPIYLAALWILTSKIGIVGTAAAWTGRMVFDCIILFFVTERKLLNIKPDSYKLITTLFLTLTLVIAGFLTNTIFEKIATFMLGLPIFLIYAWTKIIPEQDKSYILNHLKLGKGYPP